MKIAHTTAEGQNMRAWVLYHSRTSLEDFLMWELDTLQYDAITVCFPSRDSIQPNSLVSVKPNSIRHLIMLRKYIHHSYHMNYWLQKYTTHQFTYFIYYLFQDNFRNVKMM